MKRNVRVLRSTNNSTVLAIALILISLTIIISSTFAYFMYTIRDTSDISFGAVQLSDETEVGISGKLTDILPGTVIINNPIQFSRAASSEPFYVRAKVAFSLEEGLSDREKAVIVSYLDSLRRALDFDINHEPQNGAFWSERDGNYFYLLDGNGLTLKEVDDMFIYKLCDEIMVPRSLDQAANHGQYMNGINFHVSFQTIQTINVGTQMDDIKEMFDVVFPEPQEEKIHEGFTKATMIVDDQFINEGEVVNYTGKEFITGLTAFDSLQAAVDHAVSFDEILLLPGTYKGDIVINKDNLSILGANAGIDPVTGVWSEKTTIVGGIRVNADNFTLNGVELVLDSSSTFTQAISVTKNNATGLEVLNNIIRDNKGTTSNLLSATTTGNTNFIIKNNWFDHAFRSSGSSSIYILNIEDITIENCTFETSFALDNPAITNWNGYGVRLQHVSGKINILNNDFSDYVSRSYSMIMNYVLTNAKEINIFNNRFGGGYVARSGGISIDYIYDNECIILIHDNDFVDITGTTIYIRPYDTSLAHFVISISNNNFIRSAGGTSTFNLQHMSNSYMLFENNYSNASCYFNYLQPSDHETVEEINPRDEEYKVRFRAYTNTSDYQYWIRRVSADSPTMLIPHLKESQNFVITSWNNSNGEAVEVRDTTIVLTGLPFVNNATTITANFEAKKIEPGLLIVLPSHSVRKEEIKTIDFGTTTPTSMPELTLEDIGNDVCFTGKFFADKDCTTEFEFGTVLSSEGTYVYAEMYDSRDLDYQEMEGYYLAKTQSDSTGTIYIPSYHNDLPVSGVNVGSASTLMIGVVFSSNVQNLYNNAFNGCTELAGTIEIGSSITSIGADVFGGCEKITTFYIDSQSVLDSIIARNSLGGAMELGVTQIYVNTTLNTNSISQFLIDNTTKDESQTYDYKGESYTLYNVNYIPVLSVKGLDDTTLLSYRVFKGETIQRPELGFNEIGNDICFTGEFYQEAEYINLFEFGNGITEDTDIYAELYHSTVESASMSAGTIENAYTNDSTLIIPSYYNGISVTGISRYTFYESRYITSLVLPYGITAISTSNLFRNYATNLADIKLPRSIQTMTNQAFQGIPFYTNKSNTKYWINNRLYIDLGSLGKAIIHNATTSITELTAEDLEGVVMIGGRAFYNNAYLTSVTLSDDVKIIDTYAFYGNTALTTFVMNDAVETIGTYAFRNCYQLTSIDLPDSLISIGAYAFYGDTALTTITIPENVVTISSNAFTNCTNLTEVYIDSADVLKGITSISAMGGILQNTSNVYIRSDISEDDMSSYLTGGLYTKDESQVYIHDGKEYYKWSSVNIELTYQDGSVQYVQARGSSVTSSIIPNKSTLVGVVIPKGITTIDSNAFESCTLLTSVTFPDTLLTIGTYAFSGCSALTSITLPNSVTDISTYAFNGCSGLTSVDLGDSVQMINNYAFQNCSSLRTVDFGNSLVTLAAYAFRYCTSLQNVTLPSTIETVGVASFYGATSLRTVDMENGKVEIISEQAFYGCTALTTVKLSTTVKTLNLNCFYNCNQLTTINLASIETINQDAFYGCINLNNITLGENLTYIYSTVFNSCTKLKKIYVDSTEILRNLTTQTSNGYAFNYAQEIFTRTNISIGDMGAYMKSGVFVQEQGTWYDHDGKAYYRWTPVQIKITYVGGIVKYVFAQGHTLVASSITSKPAIVSVEVPRGITTIESYAFQGCTKLTGIYLPGTITSIGSYAFEGCTSLINLQLPDSLTSLSGYVFANCTSLSFIKFPSNLNSLSSHVFAGCTSLASIDLPNSLTYIESGVFNNCTKLNNVVIPQNVTSIYNAFINCTSLINFYIDGYELARRLTSNQNLGNATSYIKNLYFNTNIADSQIGSLIKGGLYSKDVTQVYNYKGQNYNRWTPNTVTFIYEGGVQEVKDITGNAITSSMISNPSTLIGVVIPEGITSITSAFQNCSKLTMIDFPSTLTTISDSAFRYCTGLTTITLPDTITSIASYAFANCTNLQSINLNKVTSINSYAFQGCTKLDTIDFGSVTSIGSYAFNGCTQLASIDTKNVTSIGSYAFQSCTNLESVALIQVRTLSGSAFYGCTKLNNVVIPSTLTSMSSYVFQGCTALINVYIDSTYVTGSLSSSTSMGYLTYYAEKIYILSSITDSYLNSYITNGSYHLDTTQTYEYNGSTYNLWVPNTLDVTYEDGSVQTLKLSSNTISSGLISNLSSVVSVSIPVGITVIDANAFESASKLESVTLPEGLTTINDYAFRNCKALKTITIPDSVTYIYMYAFQNCSALESIEFKTCDSTLRIDSMAFTNCSKLEEVILPEGLTYLGSNAFGNCTKLKTVHFPSTLTSITATCFRASPIETMTIAEDNSMYKIEGNCLIRKTNNQLYMGINTSVIPDGVVSIYGQAFYNCTFETISIPASITSLSTRAFTNCTKLKFVTIHNANMSFTADSFYNCSKLEAFIVTSTTGTVNTNFNSVNKPIYYLGTEEQWNGLTNSTSIDVDVYYYSEDECVYEENKYWCYDEDEFPVIREATTGEFETTSPSSCSEYGNKHAICEACEQTI